MCRDVYPPALRGAPWGKSTPSPWGSPHTRGRPSETEGSVAEVSGRVVCRCDAGADAGLGQQPAPRLPTEDEAEQAADAAAARDAGGVPREAARRAPKHHERTATRRVGSGTGGQEDSRQCEPPAPCPLARTRASTCCRGCATTGACKHATGRRWSTFTCTKLRTAANLPSAWHDRWLCWHMATRGTMRGVP